ncbi:MAG TPA: D-hexose-6-phosphate mutarotase [Candidatus Competibacteraceae bacterium]|nr:D-hexose-6-phosphate mutarotase [Candidatus Competibacteraceae bacterium]HSA46371.1 D-hexose-6-phosphate mutarotase [Candidatus Competibacteraceae bacterium]
MNASTPNPVFAIAPGAGDLPKLTLTAPDGARAEIYLHGAQVTSWVPADGQERLFLSQASQFCPGVPIRGGIPVVFPQFGMSGPLPLHGLARLMPWEFAGTEVVNGQASATFRLRDTEDSQRLWAFAFLAELTVSIGGNQLAVTLTITNTGPEPFTFTAALHTYLAVADLAATRVEGLTGLLYRDAAAGWTDHQQVVPCIDFTSEVNRIYFDAPAETRLIEPGQTTRIQTAGFRDAVVWNPAADKCATMSDLKPDDYQRFVCVEAVTVGTPVNLAPGERWQGTQRLVA